MERVTRLLRVTSCTLACAVFATGTSVADLKIQSFNRTGHLTFNELSTATVYRVEWANAPTGVWHNGSPGVTGVLARGSGLNTVTVGVSAVACFYRVVASVTNTPTAPAGMVRIPAGTNSGIDPDHGVYSLTNASAFYMDRTEVTKAQWDVVYVWAVANGYSFENVGSGKAANHPVQGLNWYDCVKWCNARSQKDGRTPCYTVDGSVYKTGRGSPMTNLAASGYRLPKVMEWEYAARGGLSGKRFPWGDIIDHTRANYYSEWNNGVPRYSYDQGYSGHDTRYATGGTPYTSPAGAFAANGYGLYDMAGNVDEWCYEAYSWDTAIYNGGGNWSDSACYVTCANMGLDGALNSSIGFRAVCR